MRYLYNNNPKIEELLSKVFPEFCHEINCNIAITFSDEIPPIFKEDNKLKGKENEELSDYPIDLLMGAYFPDTRNIVIYLQGINMIVNNKDCTCNYEQLIILVILHEIGHFWYHKMVKGENYSPDTIVQEWVAQMFTFLIIKENQEVKDCMTNLSKKQPIEYKTYCDSFFEKGVKEFRAKLKDVKSLKNDINMIIEAQKYNITDSNC